MDPNTINTHDKDALAALSLAHLLGPEQTAAEIRAMQRMTPAERVAAMYRGELSGAALRAWAASRPHELPITGLHPGVDEHGYDLVCSQGELPWILRHTPEYCGD